MKPEYLDSVFCQTKKLYMVELLWGGKEEKWGWVEIVMGSSVYTEEPLREMSIPTRC